MYSKTKFKNIQIFKLCTFKNWKISATCTRVSTYFQANELFCRYKRCKLIILLSHIELFTIYFPLLSYPSLFKIFHYHYKTETPIVGQFNKFRKESSIHASLFLSIFSKFQLHPNQRTHHLIKTPSPKRNFHVPTNSPGIQHRKWRNELLRNLGKIQSVYKYQWRHKNTHSTPNRGWGPPNFLFLKNNLLWNKRSKLFGFCFTNRARCLIYPRLRP